MNADPDRDCPLCERLVGFRAKWREREAAWHNAPVHSFGPRDARLLIVGLAPGLRGANATGRPFTGDFAGDLLFRTLIDFGFATGAYGAQADDGLSLQDCRITNAVRCVPPQNKPLPAEINQCRSFLAETAAGMPELRVILALGQIAHQSVVRMFGASVAGSPFRHGGVVAFGQITLASSYHCSRYNTNTGVLTESMFRDVFRAIRARLA
ncbi:COG1573 Uracil-DNA glycosylase [Rhabdaerophilaceae bacterium]